MVVRIAMQKTWFDLYLLIAADYRFVIYRFKMAHRNLKYVCFKNAKTAEHYLAKKQIKNRVWFC